jgi:peroxiredoxin family protein
MTIDLLGITKEEIIDGVELGDVAAYLGDEIEGKVNLFNLAQKAGFYYLEIEG